MGLFGPSIETLVERRDVAQLWKRLHKKPQQHDLFLKFPDEAWNEAYSWWIARGGDKGKDAFDLALLISTLTTNNKGYAGNDAMTPYEFDRRWARQFGSMASDSRQEALCPVCEKYLSEDPLPSERGMYRECTSCLRHYHRNCAAGLTACKACGGTSWRWDLKNECRAVLRPMS